MARSIPFSSCAFISTLDYNNLLHQDHIHPRFLFTRELLERGVRKKTLIFALRITIRFLICKLWKGV